ncbi:Retrovirus-related Pol polyprotein from transposon TNT 1-94 [Hordeum vulgare]|nr:Retrovirus-related Pol polyprotein from transposon TNT 1-94 [Hordeum vulgare]
MAAADGVGAARAEAEGEGLGEAEQAGERRRCESPISLPALEEVEFNGFEGQDHEFDLIKFILRSAPVLKRMTVKLSEEASASSDGCSKIYNIFKAYSSVDCDVYHSSGFLCLRIASVVWYGQRGMMVNLVSETSAACSLAPVPVSR